MPEQKLDPNIRLLRSVAITTLLWGGTFVATKAEWATHAEGLPARLAVVILGVGGFVPVLFVYARSIRLQDEFNQRLHLIALALAFAALALISYAADLLHQADFIPQLPATGLWALMVAVWFVSMLVTPRFYR